MLKLQKVRTLWLCVVILLIVFSYIGGSLADNSLETSSSSSTEIAPLAFSSCQTATFGTPTSFSTGGSGSQAIAVADFNHDGNPDLVTANLLTNDISLILGNKTGSFTSVGTFKTELGMGPRSIVVGDFNRDGSLDVATADFITSTVSVFLANPIAGGFSIATNFALGDGAIGPIFITTTDLNKDGILDLVTANFSTANISILFGDGVGGFGNINKLELAPTIGPRSIVVNDFNRDGNADLAIANFNTNNISLLLGNGSGGFSPQVVLDLQGGQMPFSIVAADFNRDGFVDLATSNNSNNISVLLGGASGSFSPATNFDLVTGTGPQSIQVGDFNRDGILDIATANASSGNVSTLLGDGDGKFSRPVSFTLPEAKGIQSLVIADFNHDNKFDIVTVNQTSNVVSVLLNDCAVSCRGSLSLASNVAITDTVGPQAMAVADFNRDGIMDVITANPGSGNLSMLRGDKNGNFAVSNRFTSGGMQPFSIATGDFNRDGNVDVVTVDVFTSNAYMLLGDGTGSLGTPSTIDLTSTQPVAIVADDFNRDGNLDIVIANAGNSTVSLLYGTGNGQFSAPTDFPLNGGFGPFALAVADFNQDGFLDVATANLASNNVSILLGSSFGFSSNVNNFGVTSSNPRAIATGDFNGDGAIDIIIANSGSNNLSLLLGDGKGNFTGTNTIALPDALKPSSIVVADFNLDANLDLAVTNANSNNVSLLFGNGTGNFVFDRNLTLSKSRNPVAIIATDVNRDSIPDLLIANNGSIDVSVLLNLCNCNITLAPTNLAIAQRNTAYSQKIIANNGTSPYVFSISGGLLPAGFSLSSAGDITGTTQDTGIFTFTLTVTDSSGCSINQNYSLLVSADPAVSLIIETVANANVGQAIDVAVRAVDANGNNAIGYTGTVSFSSSEPSDVLPANLSFVFADLASKTLAKSVLLQKTGNHRLTVTDVNNPNLTGFVDIQVNKAETRILVNSLENPTSVNTPVSFSVVVSSVNPTTAVPTGTVTFVIDGVEQSPINVVNGEANLVIGKLGVGNHQVIARYDGNDIFAPSISPSFIQKITSNKNNDGQ